MSSVGKMNPGSKPKPSSAISRKAAKAPHSYRPQPTPKCLQLKAAPGPSPKVAQLKTKEVRPEPRSRIVIQRKEKSIIQPFVSRIVQATKLYPNLHPGAIEPVDTGNVFRLHNFANQYRLHRVNSHSVNVPNQQYNFVRTREGDMLLHARYRHPSIAEGKQVLYAGEIYFNNGQLEWWSNGSGHYQPYVEDAVQANLPMDQFYSYQQVIKGEHKRKKG